MNFLNLVVIASLTTASTIAFSATPISTISCAALNESMTKLEPKDIAKCKDLEAQKTPLFGGTGFSNSRIGDCMRASSRSAIDGTNACRIHAIDNGLNPDHCTLLVNFKSRETDLFCDYRSIYYMKGDSNAFIGFTLNRETQEKLFRESQSRGITVRELMNEKLQR